MKKLDLYEFKYKMHKYDNLSGLDLKVTNRKDVIDSTFAILKSIDGSKKGLENLRSKIEEQRENKEQEAAIMRGLFVDKGPLTQEEYSQTLYSYFRSGATSDDDMEEQPVEIEKIIAVLKDTKAKKEVETWAKKNDEEFSKILKDINEIERKLSTAKEKDGSYTVKHADNEARVPAKASSLALEQLRLCASTVSVQKDIEMQFFRAWRTAYAERDSVYKRVCLAAFRYKRK